MRWYSDASRIDEGCFVCSGDRNHKESLRDGSIFDGLRTPLALSFRLIFKELLEPVPVSNAAFHYDTDFRTAAQHYNFSRRVIHDHMENRWEAEPLG